MGSEVLWLGCPAQSSEPTGVQGLLCALSPCAPEGRPRIRCSYPLQEGGRELVALAPLGDCHGLLAERLLVSLCSVHLMCHNQTPVHRAGDV